MSSFVGLLILSCVVCSGVFVWLGTGNPWLGAATSCGVYALAPQVKI